MVTARVVGSELGPEDPWPHLQAEEQQQAPLRPSPAVRDDRDHVHHGPRLLSRRFYG